MARSRVNTYAFSPRGESLARATASSSDWTHIIGTIGPKISSRMTRHRRVAVGQDGGLEELPGAGQPLAPADDARPLLDRVLDVTLGDLDLPGEGDGPDVDVVARRVPLPELCGQRRHPGHEGRVHAVVHVHALDRDADLAAVGEPPEDDRAGRALEIAVLAGQERRLASELHRARDESSPARGGDLATGLDGAREDAVVDPGLDERLPGGREADDDAEEVLGQARSSRRSPWP